MKLDLSIILLALYSTSAIAAAIPDTKTANEVTAKIDARGLGTFFSKLGKALVDKGEKIKENSNNMKGGDKWGGFKDWIKEHSSNPGSIIVNGKPGKGSSS